VGKAIAYLVLAVVGVLLLRTTGLFDGVFDRGNMEERAGFWNETVARDAPAGTSKETVDALMAKHGIALECFHSSLAPPMADCLGDDPGSKGGTSGHPVVLQLRFSFTDEKLQKFETTPRVLQ
jgi:hypothetical protein